MVETVSSHSSKFAIAIELSNPNASVGAHAVALFSLETECSKLVDSLPVPSSVRSADALMVLVETLCTKHQIVPSEIERVIVSIGPGGYTALRISSTTAKVLADTIGCLLIAVPSAAIASQSIESSQRPALIALASKNNQAHCTLLATDGSLEEVGVIDASKVETYAVHSIVGDAHLPETFVCRAAQLGIEIVPIELDARNVLKASVGIEPINPLELSPQYAREPDAVTQWRERSK